MKSAQMFPKPKKIKKEKKPKIKAKFAKPKTKGIKYYKDKVDEVFSKYIRTRDALETTGGRDYLICITCDKEYPAFGRGCAQSGHFIQGRHPSVLFDERNAHGQCWNCNMTLKGNLLKYYRKMQIKYGDNVIAELEELDKLNPHYKITDYMELEKYYKQKLESLLEK